MLRSLKQARYSDQNVRALRAGRAQLHALHFAHPALSGFDRASHSGRAPGRDDATTPTCAGIADSSSDTERRAAEAERELVEWKKVKFMIDRVGDEFAALIISTTRFGFFVELEDMFIEGLVPLDTLPGDRSPITKTRAKSSASAAAANSPSATM